ncbi:MAG: helix-turn-helix domain-containing protein [Gemmatimonadales bacterium]|nr:helix-turn-helix domain-containing protein [Gemmatimonadales bacterium]
MDRNVDISKSDFPDRLRKLREERRLTQADLGDLAQLSYRTIHDLELGKRDRTLVKTLMLITKALDVSYERLLNGDQADRTDKIPPPKGKRFLPTTLGVLLLLSVAILALWTVFKPPQWTVTGNTLVAKDGIFGFQRWQREFPDEIAICQPAPWSGDVLLVGLHSNNSGGSRLHALSLRSGNSLWEVQPDVNEIAAAFGRELVFGGGFNCSGLLPADLDGDGTSEILAHFSHTKWFPHALCLIDSKGNLLSQYASMGSIYDLLIIDMDGDKKDEVIGAGTNNARIYQGATVFVLDENHFSGATIDDSVSHGNSIKDGSLMRLVIPQYPAPYMNHMQYTRLIAENIETFERENDDFRMTVFVGHDPDRHLIVELDSTLTPLDSHMSDVFRMEILHSWPDSLREFGPLDPGWRRDWLAHHVRFEAGKRVHP